MSTYLDTILDERMNPVFDGTPEKTLEWLKTNMAVDPSTLKVRVGNSSSVVSVATYFENFLDVQPTAQAHKEMGMTPNPRMLSCGHVSGCWCGICHVCED